MGPQGALLITRERALRADSLAIEPVSVVGAGDSFLGAVVWSLARNDSLETVLRGNQSGLLLLEIGGIGGEPFAFAPSRSQEPRVYLYSRFIGALSETSLRQTWFPVDSIFTAPGFQFPSCGAEPVM